MTRITSLKIMLLGIIGALAGAVVLLLGTLSSPESLAFFGSPEFVTWFLINEVLFAFYPILWAFVLKPATKFTGLPIKKQLEIIGASILLFILFMLLPMVGARVINMQPLPFAYADLRIGILEVIGFLASALPISVSIWLIQAAIDASLGERASEKSIQKHIDFRKQLHRYLTILGILLSLFILAGAALRNAAIATGATAAEDYPSIYLLVLGAYYTLLAVLVYLPTQQTLVSAGYALLDACFPLPAPDSDAWSTAYSNRKDLEELLELKVTIEQRLLTGVTLLAPFFSSIFSLLVEQ